MKDIEEQIKAKQQELQKLNEAIIRARLEHQVLSKNNNDLKAEIYQYEQWAKVDPEAVCKELNEPLHDCLAKNGFVFFIDGCHTKASKPLNNVTNVVVNFGLGTGSNVVVKYENNHKRILDGGGDFHTMSFTKDEIDKAIDFLNNLPSPPINHAFELSTRHQVAYSEEFLTLKGHTPMEFVTSCVWRGICGHLVSTSYFGCEAFDGEEPDSPRITLIE